jgi:hypothetical protein
VVCVLALFLRVQGVGCAGRALRVQSPDRARIPASGPATALGFCQPADKAICPALTAQALSILPASCSSHSAQAQGPGHIPDQQHTGSVWCSTRSSISRLTGQRCGSPGISGRLVAVHDAASRQDQADQLHFATRQHSELHRFQPSQFLHFAS